MLFSARIKDPHEVDSNHRPQSNVVDHGDTADSNTGSMWCRRYVLKAWYLLAVSKLARRDRLPSETPNTNLAKPSFGAISSGQYLYTMRDKYSQRVRAKKITTATRYAKLSAFMVEKRKLIKGPVS